MNKMDPDIKKLVLWRIETTVPKNFKLSVGDKGTFDKEELKRHVEEEDEIGIEVVNSQTEFIKALTSGRFSKILAG